MNGQKAVTYSLLAHIRNNASLIDGPLDIFVPLIKRAISHMNKDKIFSGESLIEINEYSQKLYDIDFPVPVLRRILEIIALEVSESGQGAFFLHEDNSFSIANYTFTEFDETVRQRKEEIGKLEELFQDFCGESNIKIGDRKSIFSFLEKNKLSLGKYLSNSELTDKTEDFTAEAQFIKYFKKIPVVYDLLKSLYLGSLLSEYIEYSPENVDMDVELLLDTNFIISLIDLNTVESTKTCNTLIDIAKSQGYKLSILIETIEEIKFLLAKKAETLNTTYLVKKIYAEDILNACQRRSLTKVDIERIIDNIESTLHKSDISIITDYNEIKKEALESDDYEYYKSKRMSDISAKHDVYALYYVKNKRGYRKLHNFSDVNCWFVNNAITRGYTKSSYENSYQPEIIKADDLLSILWLSNPQVNSLVSLDQLADIGISSLVSLTFTESLPKTAIIQELEDNIQKYAKEDIKTQDIIRVATRIADKQLTNIEELNKLAKEDQEKFVNKLEEEAQKQSEIEAERLASLAKIVEKFEEGMSEIEKIREKDEEKAETIKELKVKDLSKDRKIHELEDEIKKRDNKSKQLKIDERISIWRRNSRLIFIGSLGISLISFSILYFYFPGYIDHKAVKFTGGGLVTLIIWFSSKHVYDSHFNHSNISNYKNEIE